MGLLADKGTDVGGPISVDVVGVCCCCSATIGSFNKVTGMLGFWKSSSILSREGEYIDEICWPVLVGILPKSALYLEDSDFSDKEDRFLALIDCDGGVVRLSVTGLLKQTWCSVEAFLAGFVFRPVFLWTFLFLFLDEGGVSTCCVGIVLVL